MNELLSREEIAEIIFERDSLRLKVKWYEKYLQRALRGSELPYQREELEREWAQKDLENK